jgi:hypothetical protein
MIYARIRTAGLSLAAALVHGCGASDRQAPDPSTLELTKPDGASGDGQVGVAGERLPDSLRVLVTRDGEPVEGVSVLWFTTEGSVDPAEARTGPDGMAATTWTTMALFAEQFATARVEGGPKPVPARRLFRAGRGDGQLVLGPRQQRPQHRARRRVVTSALGRAGRLAEVARVPLHQPRHLWVSLLDSRCPRRHRDVGDHHGDPIGARLTRPERGRETRA